jgi:hypothetical protein
MDGGVVLREIRSLSNANQWSAVVKVLTGDRRSATGDRQSARSAGERWRACGRRMVHFSDGVFCGIVPDVAEG